MKMRKRVLGWMPALLLATACASTPGVHYVTFRANAPTSLHELPYTPEAVRAALPLVYKDDLGLPGGFAQNGGGWDFMTPQLGVRGQLYGRHNSDFIDCADAQPGPRLADTGHVTLAMITRLEPGSNGGTRVRTQLDARVRRREDTGGGSLPCASVGLLEEAIAAALAKRLGGGATAP
ncbi:MAG TPA: hypothetical protein VNP72_03460 [Longimicrobium sp.]|nr:hypothetical protein [Longimicrobium sp.]